MDRPLPDLPKKGWTSAAALRAGDRLATLNGELVTVEQVQHELLETPIKVYNFEVEDFHTYFVGDEPILVHNTCQKARVTNVSKAESPIWKGLTNYKNGVKTSGSGRNQKFYYWDSLHNEIEVYNHLNKHIGVMDPVTGEMIKTAVKGRTLW